MQLVIEILLSSNLITKDKPEFAAHYQPEPPSSAVSASAVVNKSELSAGHRFRDMDHNPGYGFVIHHEDLDQDRLQRESVTDSIGRSHSHGQRQIGLRLLHQSDTA